MSEISYSSCNDMWHHEREQWNYIENQIRLQIEGKEAMNTVPSVFIGAARHYNPTNLLTIN